MPFEENSSLFLRRAHVFLFEHGKLRKSKKRRAH